MSYNLQIPTNEQRSRLQGRQANRRQAKASTSKPQLAELALQPAMRGPSQVRSRQRSGRDQVLALELIALVLSHALLTCGLQKRWVWIHVWQIKLELCGLAKKK